MVVPVALVKVAVSAESIGAVMLTDTVMWPIASGLPTINVEFRVPCAPVGVKVRVNLAPVAAGVVKSVTLTGLPGCAE